MGEFEGLREPRAMSREIRARFGPPNFIRATEKKQQTGSCTAQVLVLTGSK
jgi:uncharacterized protein (DUF2141 family)